MKEDSKWSKMVTDWNSEVCVDNIKQNTTHIVTLAIILYIIISHIN